MKIIAGMNSIDDYIDFVNAGVDEVFIGYIPFWYYEKRGMHRPINRREVLYVPVQIGSKSELEILYKMYLDYHVPVTITLNALSYEKEDYPLILQLIDECVTIGLNRFIIADLALFMLLKDRKDIIIHISGEMGEINYLSASFYKHLGASRIVFPRHTTLDTMEKCIDSGEYEAFVLNEKCHFHGAYCNSIHVDELCHICLVPYQLLRGKEDRKEVVSEGYLLGESGCGLCALYKMKEIGITHLKLVSRGNQSEITLLDIQNLKKALKILEQSNDENEYIKTMKNELFDKGCSGNCYYVK